MSRKIEIKGPYLYLFLTKRSGYTIDFTTLRINICTYTPEKFKSFDFNLFGFAYSPECVTDEQDQPIINGTQVLHMEKRISIHIGTWKKVWVIGKYDSLKKFVQK